MSEFVLRAQGVSKVFDATHEHLQVLQGVDIEVEAGEFVAIVGSSGCGKTTLLHILGGLATPSAGEVRLMGMDFSRLDERDRGRLRNLHMGFVYQFHHLLPEFSAQENVAMPLLIRAMPPAMAMELAAQMLARVGLAARLRHKPAELSGGERQRVALARALVTQPAVVLADEPTGNLDDYNARAVHALIMDLNEQLGTSFVIVTHERALARQARRVLGMRDGRLEEQMDV